MIGPDQFDPDLRAQIERITRPCQAWLRVADRAVIVSGLPRMDVIEEWTDPADDLDPYRHMAQQG